MNKNTIKTVLGVLVGNTILAFVVVAFVLPSGLVMGGATGLGLAITHYLPGLELSAVILGINMLLFILGALILGKKFALTTIISTVFYPMMLKLLGYIPGIDGITDNILLAVVYAGLLLGLGIGIIIRAGASTGGSDILALLMQKGFHIPVAICMYIVDFVIIALQVTFATAEELLYGILALIICTMVLGRVTVMGQAQMQLFIISKHYEVIKQRLLTEMEVGATLVRIETGLLEREESGVLCILPNRKLYDVNRMIHEVDPKAFVTITKINEVRGRGFTLDRKDKALATK